MKNSEKSSELRTDALFLRDSYTTTGTYGFPLINKAPAVEIGSLIPFKQMKQFKKEAYQKKLAVHFFKDDNRFERYYYRPNHKDILELAQYPFVFTPDFSLYPEMGLWRQIEQVGKSRWCGAHWQAQGLSGVIPSISWADEKSFAICFAGIEEGSAVAISTVSNHKSQKEFMIGYNKMLEVIKPAIVYCYGEPFSGMGDNVIKFPYEAFLKEGA